MKLPSALALSCLALLSACNMQAPERVPAPSRQFSGDQEDVPVKAEHIHFPTYCPEFLGIAYVTVAYTLEPDGSVSHVKLLSEKPAGCGFGGEVVYSFRKWRFNPQIENGAPVRVDKTYTVSIATHD